MVDTATATERPATGAEPSQPASPRLLTVVAIAAVVLLTVAIRAVTLTSALPYSNYVDERFTVTGSSHQVAESTWDSGRETNSRNKYVPYLYPSLLMDATTLSAFAYSAATGQTGELRSGARATLASPYAEVIEPRSLILSGRIIVLLLSAAMTDRKSVV